MDNLINRDWQVSNLDGVSLAELKQTVDQAKSTIDKLFAHQRLAGLSTKDQTQQLEKRQLEQQQKIYAQTSASTTTSNLNSKQQQQQHFFSNGYQGKFTSGICSPGSNTQQDSSYSSIQAIKTIKQESKDNLSGGGLKDVREKLFQQRETKEDQFKQSQKYLQTKQQSQLQLQSSSESQIKQHQTSQQSSKDIIIEDNKAHIVTNNQIKQQQQEDKQQCQEPSIDTRNGEGNEEIGQLMEMLKGLQKRVAGVEKKNNNNNQQSKSNKQLQNNQDRRGSKKSNRKHGKNKRKEEKDYASSSESITSSCSSSSSSNSSSISGDSRGSKRNDTKDIENQENIKIFLRNMRIDRSMFREFKDAFGSETIFLRDVKQNRYKTLFFKLLGFTNHIANTTGISRNTNNNICSSISKTEGNEQLYPFSDALNLNANTIKNTLMSNNHALHIRQGSPLKQRQKRFELVDRRIKTSCNNYNNNSSYDYSFLNHSSNLIMPSQQQSPFNQQQQHITGSPLSQQQLIKINEDFTSQMSIPLDKIDVTGRQFRKHNSNKSEQIDFRQQKHALQGPLSHRGAINQAEQYPMINANAVQVEQSYQQRLNIAIQQQQKEQLIQQQQKLQLQQQLQQQFSLQQFQLKQQEMKNISSSSPSSFVLQPPYQPQQQQQQQQQQFGFNGMNVQQKSEPLLLRQQLLAQHQKIQYPQQQQQFIQNQFQFPNNQGNNGNFPFFSVPQPNHWEYQRDGQYQQQEIQLPSSGLKPLVNQPQQLQYQQLYQTPKQSEDLVVPQNSEQQQQKRKDEFIMLDDSQGDDTIPLKNNIKHPQQQEHEQHNQRPTTPQEQHNRQRSNQGGSRASLINGLPTKKEKQSKSPQTLPLACEQCKDRKQSLRAYATSSSEIDYPQEKTRPSNSKPNNNNNNNLLKVPSLNLNKMDGDNNLPNKISQFRASPLIGASPRNSRSQSCNNKARTPSNQFEKRVSPYEPGEEDALKKGFSNNPIYSVMPHLRVVYKKRQNEEALNKSREAVYYEGNQQKSQDETYKTPEQQISRNSFNNFDQNENSVNHNTSNRNNNNKIKKQKYSINLVKSDSLEGGNNF